MYILNLYWIFFPIALEKDQNATEGSFPEYNVKGGKKKMSQYVFFNFSELKKVTVFNDTFLISILEELSKNLRCCKAIISKNGK